MTRIRKVNSSSLSFSIEIPPLDFSDIACVRFAYHMYGASINKLSLVATRSAGTTRDIFSRTGSQGQQWNLAEVQFRHYSDDKVNKPNFIPSIQKFNLP